MRGRKKNIARKVAEEYCRKYASYGNRTIARMLFKKESACFSSFEHAYGIVRRTRGASGNKGRHASAQDSKCLFSTHAERRCPDMPESLAETMEPYELGSGAYLVMADLHIPFHDTAAINLAVKWAKANFKLTHLLLLGDTADFYGLSVFAQDPRLRDFPGEVRAVNMFLDVAEAKMKVPIIWKNGNHEYRYEKYLYVKAPEMVGLEAYKFENLIEAERRGIEVVEANRIIIANKLTLLHGHEYNRGIASPVNPARGMFMRAKDCTLSAHEHRTSGHSEPTIRGRQLANWSIGCLCGLSPAYRPLNNWNLGFAIVEVFGDSFQVHNKKIIGREVFSS